MPRFHAYQPTPPSSSPPICESSFVSCRTSKLLLPLPPLPPLHLLTPHLFLAVLRRSSPHSTPPPPTYSLFLLYALPLFNPPPPPPPPLQLVSPHLCHATF